MNIALILSGGTGTRLGADIPKQYIEVQGRPILLFALERLLNHNGIDALWIVAAREWQDTIAGWLSRMSGGSGPAANTYCGIGKGKFRGFSLPGANRQLSILNGLEDIRKFADEDDWVLIHDAARPMLSSGLITEILNAAKGHDGAIPVLPMKDTVYASRDGRRITSLLDRSSIYAGQAPEVFRLGKYDEANRSLLPDAILKINGSTEPAVMAGMDIAMILGEEGNFKITTEADLEKFRKIAAEQFEG